MQGGPQPGSFSVLLMVAQHSQRSSHWLVPGAVQIQQHELNRMCGTACIVTGHRWCAELETLCTRLPLGQLGQRQSPRTSTTWTTRLSMSRRGLGSAVAANAAAEGEARNMREAMWLAHKHANEAFWHISEDILNIGILLRPLSLPESNTDPRRQAPGGPGACYRGCRNQPHSTRASPTRGCICAKLSPVSQIINPRRLTHSCHRSQACTAKAAYV